MIKCQVYFKEQTTSKEYVNLLTFLTVVTALIIFSNAAYYLDCEESFCLCVALEICSITSLSANFLICISTPSSSLRCHSSFTQCGRHKQNLPMSSARAKCPELRTAGLWGWFHAMGCEQWCPPLPCWAREAGVQGSLDVTPPAARDDRSCSHCTEAARHPTADSWPGASPHAHKGLPQQEMYLCSAPVTQDLFTTMPWATLAWEHT